MNKGNKILTVILIILIVVGIGFLIWKNGETKQGNNTSDTTNTNNITNTTNTTSDKKINNNVLESSVSKAIIEILNEEIYKDVSEKEGTIGAEGHKILKSEMKDGKIYAYVVAEYGVYKLEDDQVFPVSASASPITLVFDTDDTYGYKMIKYILPSDDGDEAWLSSLKEMLPEDLIESAKSINYSDDLYQNQIKTYVELLKTNKTNGDNKDDAKQALLDVMNSKQKFIDEENKEVYFKNFEIVENQTAKVKEYAFVDMDQDGIEELVIYTTSDYGAYIVLHYENNKVYGYMIGVRSLENLKTDGSFMASSGANSVEYLRMTFNKNNYKVNTEAVYDATDKTYKINNKDVSEKEIKEYEEKWNKKENVKWSK